MYWMDRLSGQTHGLPADEFHRNPYKGYRILLDREPVMRSYQNRGWMILGHEEIREMFRDPRFGSDMRVNKFLVRLIRLAAKGRPVVFIDNPTMLNLDPPDHTRLRKLAAKGFTSRFIQSLEPRIEEIVATCLDSYDGSGSFDAVDQLARPLPGIVIAELLGVPTEDLAFFQELSTRILGLSALNDEARMESGVEANDELRAYFTRFIEQRRDAPGQDFIGQLIAAEEEGDRLTTEEMLSTCILLIIAGHETTTRLIANGLYLLLQHPEQMQRLRNEPELMENAIEEMLRFEPPVQEMPRFVREDFTFHGKKLKRNQLVLAVIASANRDPRVFDDGHRFDITRSGPPHVGFGYGIHLCLGIALARLEARIALTRLLDYFSQMTLQQPVQWSNLALVRGMDTLHLEVSR